MLNVIMYHYVRDLPRTAYPKIKGMLLDDFREQVRTLSEAFEMASLETCMAYLKGEYAPKRDLCLLTFDDGLKEHFTDVTPILRERGIQGVFHVITSCPEEHAVVPVHMNHFLMAELDFDEYRRAFIDGLAADGSTTAIMSETSRELARKAYPWDALEIASFKYFFNFQLEPGVRDRVVGQLFRQYIGSVREFSEELYLNWDEARQMQRAGMAIGGHTHEHRPLASLSASGLKQDLETCTRLLHENLHPQAQWPFCYPYGKSDSFQPAAIEMLTRMGYHCGFTTESGSAEPGDNTFTVRRFDCKKAPTNSTKRLVHSGGVR